MNSENESFSKTLNLYAQKYLEENDYMKEEYYQESLELFNSILNSFEIFGGFLDCIPIEEREEIIQSRRKVFRNGKIDIIEGKYGLLQHIQEYLRRPQSLELIKEYQGVDKPNRKVAKHLKIIKEFEELVSGAVQESDEGQYYIPYYDEILTTLETINVLKDDLENKKFDIFSRYNYYAWKVETKTPLKNFLDDLIKRYKISNCQIDKKQLIDNF